MSSAGGSAGQPSPINHGVADGRVCVRTDAPAPTPIFRRGLDAGTGALGVPIAYVEISPAR